MTEYSPILNLLINLITSLKAFDALCKKLDLKNNFEGTLNNKLKKLLEKLETEDTDYKNNLKNALLKIKPNSRNKINSVFNKGTLNKDRSLYSELSNGNNSSFNENFSINNDNIKIKKINKDPIFNEPENFQKHKPIVNILVPELSKQKLTKTVTHHVKKLIVDLFSTEKDFDSLCNFLNRSNDYKGNYPNRITKLIIDLENDCKDYAFKLYNALYQLKPGQREKTNNLFNKNYIQINDSIQINTINETTPEIIQFINKNFSNDYHFDNLCRELNEKNIYNGDFKTRIKKLINKVSQKNKDTALQKFYSALIRLKPNSTTEITGLFQAEIKKINTRPGYTPDSIEGKDLLDRQEEINAFARLIASRELIPPLAVGIFGNWGSGKSFFMKKIEKQINNICCEVKNEKENEIGFCKNIAQITFNAWHYMDSKLFASLVTHIFEKLSEFVGNVPRDEQKKIDLYNNLFTVKKMKEEANDKVELLKEKIENIKHTIFYNNFTILSVNLLNQFFPKDIILKIFNEKKDVFYGIDKIKNFYTKKGKIKKLNLGNLIFNSVTIFIFISAAVLTVIFLPLILNNLKNIYSKIISIFSGIFLPIISSAVPSTINLFRDKLHKNNFKKIIKKSLDDYHEYKEDIDKNNILNELHSENTELESLIKKEQTRLITLKLEEEEIKNQLKTINRNKLLQNFIAQRLESNDYQKHLGIVSLIRKDFEMLNEYLHDIPDEIDYERFKEIYNKLDDDEKDELLKVYKINLPKKIEEDEYNNIIKLLKSSNINNDEKKETSKAVSNLKKLYTKSNICYILNNEIDISAMEETAKKLLSIRFIPLLKYIKEKELENDSVKKIRVILNKTQIRIDRIVLYIDDLDRCPYDKVIEVLQAVHLFLAFPLFIVIVGVDPRWITKSLLKKHELMLCSDEEVSKSGFSEELRGIATPYDYLEKIFQIPFRLKPINDKEKKSYIRKLLEKDILIKENEKTSEDLIDNNNNENTESTPELNENSLNKNTGDENMEKISNKDIVNKTVNNKNEPAEKIDLNPDLIKITNNELLYLKTLSPIIGDSPRSIKRLINIYHLIKSNINWFKNKNDEPEKNILLLTSVIIGSPSFSIYFFKELDKPEYNTFTVKKFITEFPEDVFYFNNEENTKSPDSEINNNKNTNKNLQKENEKNKAVHELYILKKYFSRENLTILNDEEKNYYDKISKIKIENIKEFSVIISRFSFRNYF